MPIDEKPSSSLRVRPTPHDENHRSNSPSTLSPLAPHFQSSPLNPASQTTPIFSSSRPSSSRPTSRASSASQLVSRFASEDSHARHTFNSSILTSDARGSMILYRLADAGGSRDTILIPPFSRLARDSVVSTSGDSVASTDSKYPSDQAGIRGLVPYAYDPALDENEPPDEVDMLHDPDSKERIHNDSGSLPWRGILNVGLLCLIIIALLSLFVLYPVFSFYKDKAKNLAIDTNIQINATGQAPVLFQMPALIDSETPDSARSRTGFDGLQYELVFSDEFETEGRSFYPGDDPFWEAVDLWYGATADVEWYDPRQVTTRNGSLVITMDSADTLQAVMTPGSTAPFTPAENHNLHYRSGMLQTWNKFCFTRGYIEVSVVLPGPDQNTQGYWPGAWTMGNLARPGYSATTDGMWPYTYDSCDVGTFRNQTNKDGLGPAAALHSDASRTRYGNELSWLSGQRLSACSCPGSDHPGPTVSRGRGAPEIDIFEAEADKDYPNGHVVSQSAQFAPFSHDYIYNNATADDWYAAPGDAPGAPGVPRTRPNTYRGSAVQQAVSGVTRLPPDMFQGSKPQRSVTLGFEYHSNPDDPTDGYIAWQVDDQQSSRLGASSIGPDQGPDGSGVSQRLISMEPMSIILNLGMSPNWQTIDLSTMMFPAEFKIDYVRVYQRKGSKNIGCNPKDYPTTDYIMNHMDAYMNVNTTTWNWEKPKNSQYDGC